MTSVAPKFGDPQELPETAGYSPRLRQLIAVVTVTATAIIAFSLRGALVSPHHLRMSWVAGALAAVVMGDLRLVEIRLGHNGNQFTWGEAALILGATLVGWDWFIPLGAATLLVRQLLAGRAWPKALFNASVFCVGAEFARLAYLIVSGNGADPSSHISPLTALAWAAAAASFSVWVSAAVSLAISLAQRQRFRDMFQRGLRIKVVTFLGNSAAGLAMVAVGGGNRSTVVVLPFFFLLLYLAYNNFLRAQQEGQTWRQLHAATLSLKRIDSRAVLRAVSAGGENLFGSEMTEIILDGEGVMGGREVPGLLALGLSAKQVTGLDVNSASPQVAEELRALGLHSVTLAPLESVGKRLGVLVIGFRGPIKIRRRERTVFATFADQTSISLQHARLFEELSGERGRLDAIVQHASDGILLLDGAGRVCSWNPAMTLMTGRSQQLVLGMPLGAALNALDEHNEPLDEAALIRDLQEHDQLRLPVTLTTTDGRLRELALAISTVPDAAGVGQFAVVVARDVTAQREVEQAKQDFIATVSHELRTPLTPIKGYLTLLLRPDFLPDPAKRDGLLTMMLEQTGQLERLVDDLLSVSRMQHGEFNVRLENADVREVVRRATRDFSSGSDRVVELQLPDGPALAVCDPSRLQQVVGNLLSNAEKYSPRGLPVHVVVRVGEREVELSVRDEGDGVPIDQREVVFEPFRRLGDALTSTTRGTGLGLHIARQLIEAMSGRIWVDGTPGAGAVFHITAPLAPREVVLAKEPAPQVVDGAPPAGSVVLDQRQALPSPSPVPQSSERDELSVS